MWEQAQAPTALSNAFLAPPPPSMLELFARAGRERALADRIVSGFGNAEAMLAMLAPEPAAL